MNEAAKLVSDSLIGNNYKTISIANKTYKINPPSIKVICRGISEWADVDFNHEEQNTFSVIAQIPNNASSILRGISSFIVGDVRFAHYKSIRLYKRLGHATPHEISIATALIIEMIGAQDFFDCAVLLKSVVKMAANPKS